MAKKSKGVTLKAMRQSVIKLHVQISEMDLDPYHRKLVSQAGRILHSE